MKCRKRNVYLACAVFGALLMFAIVALSLFFSFKHDLTVAGKEAFLEAEVGSVVDIRPHLGYPRALVECSGMQTESGEEGLFIDADGFLHVKRSGVYRVRLQNIGYSFNEAWSQSDSDFCVVAHDVDFSDYCKISGYDRLEQALKEGERDFYIESSFTVRRSGAENVIPFSGRLYAAEGAVVTVEDGLPLFTEIAENSVVRGLRIADGGKGFYPARLSETESSDRCGALCAVNNGFLFDCSAEGDLYGLESSCVSGLVGYCTPQHNLQIRSRMVRCAFRGCAYGTEIYGLCADGGKECLSDCAVYADRFARTGLAEGFSDTLYAYPMQTKFVEDASGGISHAIEDEAERARIFDRSGKHEVDFSRTVNFSAKYFASERAEKRIAFAGARLSRSLYPLDEKNVYLHTVTDGEGKTYAENAPFYLDEDVALFFDYRYKNSVIYYSGNEAVRICAAQPRVELPSGVNISKKVLFGPYSPAEVTVVLADDSRISLDGYEVSTDTGVAVRTDFSRSEIYECDSQGTVVRNTDGERVLCRHTLAENGVVTVPKGVTRVGRCAFDGVDFHTLKAEGAESIDADGEWSKKIETICLGANFKSIGDYFQMHCAAYPSLRFIRLTSGTDGYVTKNGILYREDGGYTRLIFVPPRYTAEELYLSDCDFVESGALKYNKAVRIFLSDVSEIKQGAFDRARAAEIVFERGETLVRTGAICEMESLYVLRAESNAAVELQERAVTNCDMLNTVRLGGGFSSVHPYAVRDCYLFRGYEKEEKAEFLVENGLYFSQGKVFVPVRWLGKDIRVPDGVTQLAIESDSPITVKSLSLGKDVQSVTTLNVYISAFDADKNAAFTVENGSLLSADRTVLFVGSGEYGSEYTVPYGVVRIADYAFCRSRFTRFVLPLTLEKVGAYAFAESAVRQVEFGGLRTIGEFAFAQCKDLHAVTLPDSLRVIPENAFRESGLQTVSFGSDLEKIGARAFYSTELTSVVFPKTLQTIGEYAFFSASLASLRLGNAVREIGNYAFAENSNLAAISVSGGTRIGKGAFKNTAYVLNGDNVEEDGCVYLGDTLLTVTGGAAIVRVRNNARCISDIGRPLSALYVPESVCEYGGMLENIDTVFFRTAKLPQMHGVRCAVVPKNTEKYVYNSDTKFYYEGSPEEYEAAGSPINGVVYYYSETPRQGNFWHYVAGNPREW